MNDSKDQKITEGSVLECLVLKHNGDSYDLQPINPSLQTLPQMSPIYGLMAGKIRRRTRLLPGDHVNVQLSEYRSSAGKTIGRIVERIKTKAELESAPPPKRRR
jgi:hypothetical protein